MENQAKTCSCGRTYLHCKTCGRRGPYYKKFRSLDLSAAAGRQISAYGHSCGAEFTNEDECKAPQISTDAKAQDEFTPGSINHLTALQNWVVEMQKKKKWDRVRVYVEAQKAGWHLEAYPDIDEEVKEALIEEGLLDSHQGKAEQEAPMRGEEIQSPPVSSQGESVSLDDIIKNLQENSK